MTTPTPIPQLTLDTNVVREMWGHREKAPVVLELIGLAERGEVDLMVTRVIEYDIPDEPLRSRIRELPLLNIDMTGGMFRIGRSTIGGPDMIGSDRFVEAMSVILSNNPGKRAPDWRDQDHLHAHMALHRDVFLTWDGSILALRVALQDQLGIRVMAPEEFLATRH